MRQQARQRPSSRASWPSIFAALRQAIQGGKLENLKMCLRCFRPRSIHSPLARLAAPKHERLEDARIELVDNVKKLRSLELKREKAEVTEELEQGPAHRRLENKKKICCASRANEQRRSLSACEHCEVESGIEKVGLA